MRGSGLGIPHFDDMPYFFAMPPAGLLFYFLSIKLPPDFLLHSIVPSCSLCRRYRRMVRGDPDHTYEVMSTTANRVLRLILFQIVINVVNFCCQSPANNRGQEQDVNLRADMEPAQPRGEDLLEHHQGITLLSVGMINTNGQ